MDFEIKNVTNPFAIELYKCLSRESPDVSVFVSPFSVQVLLAMAYSGAAGDTAKQLENLLNIPADDEDSLLKFKEILFSLKSPEMKIASKIFFGEPLAVKNKFNRNLVKYFGSDATHVPFKTNMAVARSVINNWAKKETNGKINELISDDALGSDNTALVLLNAVHFRAVWYKPFLAHFTKKEHFYINEKETISIDMMQLDDDYVCGIVPGLNAKLLKIPFKGPFSLVILLPDKINGLSDLERKLRGDNLINEMNQLNMINVIGYLPKFKFTKTMDLNAILISMGLENMFSSKANFSGISDMPTRVSKVIQKTLINVDEQGTEATAASGMVISLIKGRVVLQDPLVFKADHPFIFIIIKAIAHSHIILFLGKFNAKD